MGRSFRPQAVVLALVLVALANPVFGLQGTGRCQASARDIDALSNSKLIYIATVRKDGNQSKIAPVWFTITADHTVLIETGPDTWKARRIRRGSPAVVWIGSKDGPAFIAEAEITMDPVVLERIVEDYPKRYLMAWVGIHRPTLERFKSGRIIAIRLIPVRDLPEGFRSEPGTPAPALEEARAGNS